MDEKIQKVRKGGQSQPNLLVDSNSSIGCTEKAKEKAKVIIRTSVGRIPVFADPPDFQSRVGVWKFSGVSGWRNTSFDDYDRAAHLLCRDKMASLSISEGSTMSLTNRWWCGHIVIHGTLVLSGMLFANSILVMPGGRLILKSGARITLQDHDREGSKWAGKIIVLGELSALREEFIVAHIRARRHELWEGQSCIQSEASCAGWEAKGEVYVEGQDQTFEIEDRTHSRAGTWINFKKGFHRDHRYPHRPVIANLSRPIEILSEFDSSIVVADDASLRMENVRLSSLELKIQNVVTSGREWSVSSCVSDRAIEVKNSPGGALIDNIVCGENEPGIDIKSDDISLVGNLCFGKSVAFKLRDGSKNRLIYNTVAECEVGFDLKDVHATEFELNNSSMCHVGERISVGYEDWLLVSRSKISSCDYGIAILAGNVCVCTPEISHCTEGIGAKRNFSSVYVMSGNLLECKTGILVYPGFFPDSFLVDSVCVNATSGIIFVENNIKSLGFTCEIRDAFISSPNPITLSKKKGGHDKKQYSVDVVNYQRTEGENMKLCFGEGSYPGIDARIGDIT